MPDLDGRGALHALCGKSHLVVLGADIAGLRGSLIARRRQELATLGLEVEVLVGIDHAGPGSNLTIRGRIEGDRRTPQRLETDGPGPRQVPQQVAPRACRVDHDRRAVGPATGIDLPGVAASFDPRDVRLRCQLSAASPEPAKKRVEQARNVDVQGARLHHGAGQVVLAQRWTQLACSGDI